MTEKMHPAELQSRRQRLGLSQAGLAARLGVSTQSIARWEQGKGAIPAYLRLALQHLALEIEEERESETNEERDAYNRHTAEELHRQADERWEQMTPEERDALEQHFTDASRRRRG